MSVKSLIGMSDVLDKEKAMLLAIKQAKKGLGRVSPNPPVGAVIVNSKGQLLSQGYHQALGADHAEIMALKNNVHSLKKATLYVTLEPCSHQGRTPSCADKLAGLPFSKVCIGLKDPNPKVCGRGIERLRRASIQVEMYEGPLKSQLEELIEIFSYNMKEQKPFIAVKIASCLDGGIAISGQKWITNEWSREYVSLLRGYYDAVCIGVQTFLTDHPRLNSRHPCFSDQENKVILLDQEGLSFTSLKNSALLQVRDPSKVIIVTGRPPDESFQLPCQVIHQKKSPFDLDQLFIKLFQKGVYSVLVEGGGEVFSSFLSKSQRLYLFLSPFLGGGKIQKRWWSEDMNFPIHLRAARRVSFQEDLLITGLLERKKEV